jgi:hypothetical protein
MIIITIIIIMIIITSSIIFIIIITWRSGNKHVGSVLVNSPKTSELAWLSNQGAWAWYGYQTHVAWVWQRVECRFKN